jgi:hypothetical protein
MVTWGNDLESAKGRVEWLEDLIKSVKALGQTPSAETKRLLREARQELAELEKAVKQVKYSYEPGESGSAWFAIWHIGADVVRIYSPEGEERASIPVDGTRFAADQAAAMFGPGTSTVVQTMEQDKIYPPVN